MMLHLVVMWVLQTEVMFLKQPGYIVIDIEHFSSIHMDDLN